MLVKLQGAQLNLYELQQADEEQLLEHELSDDDDEFASIMADAAAAAGFGPRSTVTDEGDEDSDLAEEAPTALQPRRPKKPKFGTKGGAEGRGQNAGSGKKGSSSARRTRAAR
jgi:hypothetical protein